MSEANRPENRWLMAIVPIGVVAAWIAASIFGAPTRPENTVQQMEYRLDESEAHDAEIKGDEDGAIWWHARAKKDLNAPH